MKNIFDIYTAKVKRFNIPLPEFEYHHKSSSEEQVDKKYIGRKKISARLYNWLTDEKTSSGSYLITGYRGMGKSSFVGRTLYELSGRVNIWLYTIGLIIFIFIWGELFYAFSSYETLQLENSEHISLPLVVSFLLLICAYNSFKLLNVGRVIYFCSQVLRSLALGDLQYISEWFKNLWEYFTGKKDAKEKAKKERKKYWRKDWKAWRKDWRKDWRKILHELYNADTRRKSYSRISISINLGQEVLNEKDVLCLITNGLYKKYRYYIYSPIANYIHWIVNTFCIFSLAFMLRMIWNKFSIIYIADKSIYIIEGYAYGFFVSILFLLISYVIYNFLIYRFVFTQKRILRKLRFLNERLDATIDSETGIKAQTRFISLNSGKRKTYPLANIREIEQELIDILERINRGIFPSPSFLFVFDELDKIEANFLQESFVSHTTPEYTNEKNFPGGGASRKRKQNVLRLLANMKLFVSTAKAKFIFISGRELYDAYLADLSDREFAISSVFNGIIYVESFCTNENKEKDIMSNAETYICRQLIPKSYIRKECINHYLTCKMENKEFDKIDIDLKLYYKYLIEDYKKVPRYKAILCRKQPSVQKCPENSEIPNLSNTELELRQIRVCIDKTIVLLYHFSVYLYHISNGSPKKMTLYFEKFVNQTINSSKFSLKRNGQLGQCQMLEDKDINIRVFRKSRYHLSFGYLDQRKIGFIHYISYPVTQAIINANQFGDKLLVSASFLINHIYKFHKSGFSWRNMEHTPELLEIYRIPEFRSFISSIISYLTQTHLIPISCGLYQFKFRKQFSEEISLASKFSEEIAALFNFTLDESLSVKRHYNEIQEHFSRKLDEEKTDSPHVKAGIHHILADLFMSDEEYTNAIFEYQTAIQIINFKIMDGYNLDDPHFISRMLLLIRNMLKLGLAYEKRKTYESAYVTYNELIGRLIHFRHLNESNLGLDYRIEKTDSWPLHKAVLYAGEVPERKGNRAKTVTKKVCPSIVSSNDLNEKRDSLYRTNGPDILTDFAHQMTIEKNPIIQRLSLLEDVRLVYQALLAKLFVLEKMELGGITRSNIELLESEYIFLHLATNEKDKFLISTDFFRRLGDIMYYKNGLAGQETDSFFEGLYYWGYNVKTEILDFCNENHCYHLREALMHFVGDCKIESIQSWHSIMESDGIPLENIFPKEHKALLTDLQHESDKKKAEKFFRTFASKMNGIPLSEVNNCNSHRQAKWKKGKPLPCYACKYYNRSLHILISNLYGIDIEKRCTERKCSKTIIILELLTEGGNSNSLRQNLIIQLSEVLDCMGNIMLSCASEQESISKDFLAVFLEDVYILNISADNPDRTKSNLVTHYDKGTPSLSKLERSILYYWEASECFRMGDDLKKASDSLKKILRLIQNYLKVKQSSQNDLNSRCDKEVIGEFLNEIKNRVVKKSLLYLYSRYNYINITEIQKLKWVFTVQMYENISLSHLSLFPDIEEIMLIYYEMIQLCLFSDYELDIKSLASHEDSSWHNATQRNRDFRLRLGNIYHSLVCTTARMESTIYERVLSLRFRAMLNQEVLHHLVLDPPLEYYDSTFEESFIGFMKKYLEESLSLEERLKEYKNCFPEIQTANNQNKSSCQDQTDNDLYKSSCYIKFSLLEFLIKDSMYCLTKILEMITPYTSTTLFTNTFLGEVHQKLFEWNQLFDTLYMLYKVVDLPKDSKNDKTPPSKNENCLYLECQISENSVNGAKCWSSKCPHSVACQYKQSPIEKIRTMLACDEDMKPYLAYRAYIKEELSLRFFTGVLKDIGKSNIHYTLNNYSAEMAIKCYRKALDMHKEGKSYKEMISKMYYLDDDLKNDTIQFDSAIERYKINNNYIHSRIEMILSNFKTSSLYDIENFIADNEINLSFFNRFDENRH